MKIPDLPKFPGPSKPCREKVSWHIYRPECGKIQCSPSNGPGMAYVEPRELETRLPSRHQGLATVNSDPFLSPWHLEQES